MKEFSAASTAKLRNMSPNDGVGALVHELLDLCEASDETNKWLALQTAHELIPAATLAEKLENADTILSWINGNAKS